MKLVFSKFRQAFRGAEFLSVRIQKNTPAEKTQVDSVFSAGILFMYYQAVFPFAFLSAAFFMAFSFPLKAF